VATHLVRQLPTCLSLVLTVLWACLGDMKDDLSSSVGAVMDLLGSYFCFPEALNINELLGKLVSYNEVIEILGNNSVSYVLFDHIHTPEFKFDF
jgi:TATA-binding protein-associated factor